MGDACKPSICNFVQNRIKFGYEHARPTKTAWEVYHERTGVMPGLRPFGCYVVPLHEYSSTLLHRLSGGHRRAGDGCADGLFRLV